MRRLESQAEILQRFIDYAWEWLDRGNYTLSIDTEMGRWAAVMRDVAKNSLVNPAFDPCNSRLSPDNAFWLDVRAGSATIATSAARVLATEDLFEKMRDMSLWYARPPADPPLSLSPTRPLPNIAGCVGHEGGLWVRPDHRKRGLSALLPHLNRALCLRQWDVDWQTGITHGPLTESGLVERAYGFPHIVRCFDGYLPITRKIERLYLVYMSREELLAGLGVDAISRLLPDRHGQPVHAMALVEEG
jgi:hypothetical protein